jgi:hypothetical protein
MECHHGFCTRPHAANQAQSEKPTGKHATQVQMDHVTLQARQKLKELQ